MTAPRAGWNMCVLLWPAFRNKWTVPPPLWMCSSALRNGCSRRSCSHSTTVPYCAMGELPTSPPPHPHPHHTYTCTPTHAHLTDRECPHNRSSLQIYKKPTVIPWHFIPHYTTLSLAANTSPLTSSNLAPSPSLPSPQCMGHCPLPLPPVRPVSSPLPALCNKVAGRAQTVCLVLPHPKGQHRKHADPPGQGVQRPTTLRP